MDILFVRPFFLIGPRKEGDVCSEFAKSIVTIEQGIKSSIGVGNLEIIRDFLDVRDGVEALYLISNKGINGETYNICSGVGYPLSYVLDIFRKQSNHTISEEDDPSKIRPIDDPIRIGSPEKIKKLGWEPSYHIEDTLINILQFWRSDLSKS